MHHKQGRRKLDDVSGSISIDCGIAEEVAYTDEKTQIHYTSDAQFIGTGTRKNISLKLTSEIPQGVFTTVRIFPEDKRNCVETVVSSSSLSSWSNAGHSSSFLQ
ncbi:uncharacterized protein HKW66_Vig0213130 [Vigna angularis]|uniref:Malectin-like domain-containing protein n=1 Tax=Phaseolus angularis TaxID=3914 RepID=A0A8T0JD98_PHAAN|nr:uncharacterized protein HKW66_Vig0213130 [Vigna angularis]